MSLKTLQTCAVLPCSFFSCLYFFSKKKKYRHKTEVQNDYTDKTAKKCKVTTDRKHADAKSRNTENMQKIKLWFGNTTIKIGDVNLKIKPYQLVTEV